MSRAARCVLPGSRVTARIRWSLQLKIVRDLLPSAISPNSMASWNNICAAGLMEHPCDVAILIFQEVC